MVDDDDDRNGKTGKQPHQTTKRMKQRRRRNNQSSVSPIFLAAYALFHSPLLFFNPYKIFYVE